MSYTQATIAGRESGANPEGTGGGLAFEQIAKAMIATSLSASAKSDAYHYAEMMAFNR